MSEMPETGNLPGEYFSVVCPRISDVVDDYQDVKEITLDWGSYRHPVLGKFTRTIKASEAMLHNHPILLGPCCLLREDIFSALAPFLDLDYFGVAVVLIGDDEQRRLYEKALEEGKRARLRMTR